MLICIKCGDYVEGKSFCSRCGERVEEKIFCTNCGSCVTGENFCSTCGVAVGASQMQEGYGNTAEVAKGAQVKKSLSARSKIIIGAAGFVVLAAIAAVVIVFSGGTAERPLTVAELLEVAERYLLEGNYEQALVEFIRVIETDPMEPRGYTGAAEAYVGLDNFDDAIDVLHQGLNILPDNLEILEMLDVVEDMLGSDYDIMRTESEFPVRTIEELGDTIVRAGTFWEDWWNLRGLFAYERIEWIDWGEEPEDLRGREANWGRFLSESNFEDEVRSFLSHHYTEAGLSVELSRQFNPIVEYGGVLYIDVTRAGVVRPNWETAVHILVEQEGNRAVVETTVLISAWHRPDIDPMDGAVEEQFRFTLIDGKIDSIEKVESPFATMLREFNSDAAGITAAVLVDLDGDGIYEMVAIKATSVDDFGRFTGGRVGIFSLTNEPVFWDAYWLGQAIISVRDSNRVYLYRTGGDTTDMTMLEYVDGQINVVRLHKHITRYNYALQLQPMYNDREITQSQWEAYVLAYNLWQGYDRNRRVLWDGFLTGEVHANDTARIFALDPANNCTHNWVSFVMTPEEPGASDEPEWVIGNVFDCGKRTTDFNHICDICDGRGRTHGWKLEDHPPDVPLYWCSFCGAMR